ncbi:hypothetical protein ACTFIZ_001157 [Dictyostelium cf. discoideum]
MNLNLNFISDDNNKMSLNNKNNNNNYESDNDEDEDEENLLFKDFQSIERRGNKKINNNNNNNNNNNYNNDIKEKNIKNNKITNKNNYNNKNFISKISIINNNNKFKKIKNIILQKKNLKNLIIIILSLFFILFLFYIIITYSINNKIYNYTNNKIINNNKNDIINQYCIKFLKNNNNNNNNNSSSSGNNNYNNKEGEYEEDEDEDEEKCSFDLNSPDYSCTPLSKNRVINFNYSSNYEERVNWNKPIVSVIVPFLNTEPQQFNECMESILIRQSFKLIEVILIDDGSTNDKSIKSYREWLKREPIRFRVIVNPFNLGLPHSRNIGVYNSRGDYIFFFDSDDILEPTALEKMVWKLNTSSHIQFTKGYLVGFGHTQYIWLKGFEQADKFLIENQVTISIMYKRSMFGNKLQINQSFQVDDYSIGGGSGADSDGEYFHYPKELLEFQYDSNIRDGMEDWDFHLKCASAGYWGETIPEILEWYRRKDKKTIEKNWKNTLTSKREKFLNDLKLKYSKLYNIGGGGGGGGGNDNQYKSFPNPIRNENEDSFKIKFVGSSFKEIKNPLIKKSSTPRILLILPWLNTGGADKFNLNLCKQLVEKGWEITIVTTIESDNKWLSRFQLYTPDIFLFNEKFLPYSSYPSFINYLIDSRNIDVLFISNSELGYYLLPFIKSNKHNNNNNNNLIIVDYNHMEEEYWRNGGHPRQSIGMSQFLDLHLVSSNHLKNWMLAKSNQMIDENKISVTYINVDMDEFKKSESSRHKIRKSYEIAEKEIVILYAARLTNQKKPLEACEIIKELKESLLNDFENNYQNQNQNQNQNQLFKVLFVGDGYLKSKVELYVKQNGLSDVIKLLGDVPTQDMRSIISACDIVFLPSQFEGVSMIFYESMSIGLVPVGSNVGGQSELVTPDCGFLVDITDDGGNDIDSLEFTNKFVQVLKQLIKNPKKITSMASKCKKRIKSKFQLHKMGGDIISNFCNTINKKNNQQQQKQQSLQLNDGGSYLFNQEFLIQTIEYLKLTNQFEKKKNDFNQLYSLQSELTNLKREIKKLELSKQSQK